MTKVFGIGLSRTGSTSLTEALSGLGYRAIHFPADPITQREYSDFFDNPSGTLKLSLLDRYDAITDTPLSQVYRELDRGYPGSKFIWTIRDKESWLKSCELWWRRSVIPFMEDDHLEKLRPFMRLVGRVTYGTAGFDAELFSQAYDAHMKEVPRYFLGLNRNLLPLNICAGNGWLKLAPFLGMAVPDVPFPHRNEMIPDRRGFKGTLCLLSHFGSLISTVIRHRQLAKVSPPGCRRRGWRSSGPASGGLARCP